MRHTFAVRHVLAASALIASTAALVLAGPPLICHPFDIGTAKSLPFGDASRNWRAVDPDYDRSRLVDDTLALLTPSTPVVVRMETLRRAIAYVGDDRTRAAALLAAVQARAVKAPKSDAEALALFDAAYLVDAYQQMKGYGTGLDTLTGGADGYAMLRTAMQRRPDDPAMHLAAALMTSGKDRRPLHAAHVQKARDGARADALVARNVASHLTN
jgi:hypothetical protein